MKISKKLIHSNIDRMMKTDKSDQRNLKVLPEPFSSSDLSLFGIETEVSFNDVLLREKVVVVGDECVGKSSILKSHLKKSDKIYDKNYLMTKGIELEVSEIPVPNSDIVVDLFLYDMGGQSIFNQRQMAKCYWENCSNIICVYDVSSRKSLQSVMTWVTSVRSASTARQDIPVILVANKIDLREENNSIAEIDYDEGKKYAEFHGFQYFECSAETAANVDAPFQYIANESAAQYLERQQEDF